MLELGLSPRLGSRERIGVRPRTQCERTASRIRARTRDCAARSRWPGWACADSFGRLVLLVDLLERPTHWGGLVAITIRVVIGARVQFELVLLRGISIPSSMLWLPNGSYSSRR